MKNFFFFIFFVTLSKYIYDQYILKRSYDVIIIGAGVTGIIAGHQLNNNLTVLILEGRNRTLGRVYTEKNFFKTPMGISNFNSKKKI